MLDAEIEYVNPPGAVEPGTRSGLAAFSRAVEQVFVEGWESWRFEPERFTPCGDRVAVVLRYWARGRESRVEVEGQLSALWTLREGRPCALSGSTERTKPSRQSGTWRSHAGERDPSPGRKRIKRHRLLAPPHPSERVLPVVEADAHLDDLAPISR